MPSQDFSFIQITDHHVCDSDTTTIHGFSTNYSLRKVLEHIAKNAAGADLILSTGDLVDRASAEDYRFFRQILGLKSTSPAPGPQLISAFGMVDMPFYAIPGNHDDHDLFFRIIFPQSPPSSLLNAAFTHKGVQFVFLDWGPDVKGVMHPETLSFLQGALCKGLPSILLMHHTVVPVQSRWLDEFLADGVETFWEVVAGKPVLGIFCGHIHAVFETQKQGIPFYSVGSTCFQFALQDQPLMVLTPPQYRIVRVEDGKLTTQVVDVPLERE